MRLDYGTRMSYSPIVLPMGRIRKPTLEDCTTFPMSFEKFNSYESMLLLTPELFFAEIIKGDAKTAWESTPEEEKKQITLYDLAALYPEIGKEFEEIFNFFFIEDVFYVDHVFFIVDPDKHIDKDHLTEENILGYIGKQEFDLVAGVIRQICCIGKEEDTVDDMKFKNEFQKKLYMDYLKTKAEEEAKHKKTVKDNKMVLPNIISAVASKHSSLNYTNIWKLTIFQLLDTFERLQANSFYEIDATRVSVWGDEKKTFDSTLWYRNNFENNKSV